MFGCTVFWSMSLCRRWSRSDPVRLYGCIQFEPFNLRINVWITKGQTAGTVSSHVEQCKTLLQPSQEGAFLFFGLFPFLTASTPLLLFHFSCTMRPTSQSITSSRFSCPREFDYIGSRSDSRRMY